MWALQARNTSREVIQSKSRSTIRCTTYLMRQVAFGCNPGKLSQCQLQAFIPQHRSKQTCPTHFFDIERGYHKVLFKVLGLHDDLSGRANDHGPSREVGAIFETHPIHVDVEYSVKLRGGLEKVFPPLRRCEQRTFPNAAAR